MVFSQAMAMWHFPSRFKRYTGTQLVNPNYICSGKQVILSGTSEKCSCEKEKLSKLFVAGCKGSY
jgi:hypothetical protein